MKMQVAEAKGYKAGLNNLPSQNPYRKSNPCFKSYNDYYDLGKKRITEFKQKVMK